MAQRVRRQKTQSGADVLSLLRQAQPRDTTDSLQQLPLILPLCLPTLRESDEPAKAEAEKPSGSSVIIIDLV